MKISNYPRRLLQSRTTRIIRQRTNLNGALAMALVLSLSTLAFLVSAQNETAPQVRHKHLESVPGQLLVRFRPTSEFAKLRRKASAGLGLAFKGRTLRVEIQQFGGSELVDGLMLGKVAPSDTLEAISALNARSDVLYAEPNYVRHINAVPSDPHYVDQFALKNSAPGGAGISAESAWDTTTGNHNVVVGVIDSGIDIDHRDLKDNIFVNTAEIANNGMDDDGNGFPEDVNGWDLATLQPTLSDSGINFTIVANVNAPPNTSIQNVVSATSFRTDPNPANNSASVTSFVVAETFFNGVQMVAAGRSHTTSVSTDGTVWNWGTGSNGQLGNGNTGVGVRAVTPVQVSGLQGFTAAADGNGFALALKSDGTVWSWGSNDNGQLGDGSTTQRTTPVQVSGLTNVTAIGAGGFYSAALKLDGTVWVWGAVAGLGFPTFPPLMQSTPVQLSGISNVTAISAGGNHLLLLKSDKTLWGVGANSRGQLGDGTTNPRTSPVQVNGLSNVSRIAASDDEFSVALKEDGTIWAWGINFHGELGPNGGAMNFDPHPNPIQVTGLPAGMTGVSAGLDFVLTVAGDGTVWSWGSNSFFQLGQGSQISQNPIPKQILNFNNVSSVAAGFSHGMALKTDGSLWGWGSNSEGEVGDGSTTMRLAPARVSGLETVASPSFNPPGGTFTTQIDITVSCATPGATIHFTINGNDPTESDPVVASGGTVHISSTVPLRARAWKQGSIPSSTAFAQYDINIPTNPIDTSQFFVRQHYLDFFGRQPDTPGLDFWTNNIESCAVDLHCREVKRIDTSAAFFLSIEFQETGYFVYRFYKVAFGNLPGKPVPVTLQKFQPDLQQLDQNVIVGQPGWEAQLEHNKQIYSTQFVIRPEFIATYPESMSPAAFVDALNATAGNVLTQSERDAFVATMIAGTKGRGDVVRAIAESPVVSAREFNSAFVLMQYFGYLRRNPDSAPDTNFDGYNFWLNKLNQFGGDFRAAEMVKAFIVSGEYRHRFGP